MARTLMPSRVNTILAWAAGAILVLVGALGFVMASPLFGLFEVNAIHNAIHLITGAILLGAAFVAAGAYARVTLLSLGVVYAIVALAGFAIPGTIAPLLGEAGNLMADNVLHLVLAAVFIGVPLMTPETARRPTMGKPQA